MKLGRFMWITWKDQYGKRQKKWHPMKGGRVVVYVWYSRWSHAKDELHYWKICNTVLTRLSFTILSNLLRITKCKITCAVNAFRHLQMTGIYQYTHVSTKEIRVTKTFINLAENVCSVWSGKTFTHNSTHKILISEAHCVSSFELWVNIELTT